MSQRFSVAIPVWNDAYWLPGAIESVVIDQAKVLGHRLGLVII